MRPEDAYGKHAEYIRALVFARAEWLKKNRIPLHDALGDVQFHLYLLVRQSRYDPERGKPEAFISRVVPNYLSHMVRRRKRQNEVEAEYARGRTKSEHSPLHVLFQIEEQDRVKRLRNAIRELPRIQRTIMRTTMMGKAGNTTLSTKLGLTLHRVKKLRAAAHQTLHRKITQGERVRPKPPRRRK